MFRIHALQHVKILLTSRCSCIRLISHSACLSESKKNHYQVLGLTMHASQEDIRNAFVNLSKQVHPDTNPDDPNNHDKFVRINEAYSVLSKITSRREYDVSLAYYIRARRSATSHTAGDSTAPGTGHQPNYDTNDQQSANEFWDETIWEMRDRSKDAGAFYPDDSYYGIKGIRRQTNGVIGSAVVVLVFLGFGYFFVGLGYSSKKRREDIERISARNARILREVQETARINGREKQLDILSARIAAAEARREEFLELLKKS